MEIAKPSEYILSQEFPCHTQGVRCIDVAKNLIISGSTDKTAKVFKLKDKKYEMILDINFFGDFIYVVKINIFGDGFFIGCKDGNIYKLDGNGNLVSKLQGHEGPVMSLSQIDDTRLLSGSWDGTCRVWDIKTTQELLKLEGHSHAVAVLAVESLDLIVTGSQDKNMNLWELSTGRRTTIIKQAHTDIIRQLALVEGLGFLSASNDETLKLWTFEGELISLIKGHCGFVFSCGAISFDRYLSGSDDHTVKIWNSTKCIQSILHSATIWAVAVHSTSKDIVTACGDGSVRVFTLDQSRQASEEIINDFNHSANLASLKTPQGLAPEELAKLPDVSELMEYKGSKDGEMKIFRNGQTPEAYTWKVQEEKWDKIGEVMSTIKKKTYSGDKFFAPGDYDYIFEVDEDDENEEVKSIPFNEGDNPLEAAEKYCVREGLSKAHVEQIRQFLQSNTKGFKQQKITQSSQPPQQTPPQIPSSNFFPMFEYQFFESRNIDGLKKKILEFNESLKKDNNPCQLLEKHLIYLDNIFKLIANTSAYHSSTLTQTELELITAKLSIWPRQFNLAFFDLLRMFALHPQADSLFTNVDSGLRYFTIFCGALMNEESSEMIKALVLRLLCNICYGTAGRYALFKHYKFISECLKLLENSQNQSVRTARATLLLNFSVEILHNSNHSQESQEEYLKQILDSIQKETDLDNLLKYLVAAGNYLTKAPKYAKEQIKNTLGNSTSFQVSDARVDECYKDILKLI